MRPTLAQFALLVAFAGCVPPGAPHAPHDPQAIANGLTIALDGKDVETLSDGTTQIAGHGPDGFRVVATTNVGRQPYPNEVVKAVLISGERVVTEVPFEFDARHGRATLEVPSAGTYRVEVWEQDHFAVGNTFVAAALPDLGGRRTLELHQDASPQLILPKDGVPAIEWKHWDSIDSDTAFIVEWWHDNTRVTAGGGKRSELQRQVLAQVQNIENPAAFGNQPAWQWDVERFVLPDAVMRAPGRWELRVYRDDDHAPLSFGFDVFRNGAVKGTEKHPVRVGSVEVEVAPTAASKEATRELAKLPRTRFEGSKHSFLPVTAAEARALTRSEVLRGQRARLNQLSRQATNGDPSAIGFGTRADSPQAAEAKKLVPAMQRLIGQLGDPWSDDERP